MGTLEIMWQDADRFAKQWGMENEYTIKLYQVVEDAEKFLAPGQVSNLTQQIWNRLYSYYEGLLYQKMMFEEDWEDD